MIKVYCHTNLDVHEMWPEELPCRPVIGDIIVSQTDLHLKVIRCRFEPTMKDTLVVELYLTMDRMTIAEFTKWYAKR